MLIKDIYNNSSTSEKIFNYQKTSDLKELINTIRLTTTITRNSVNVSIGIFLYIYINKFNKFFVTQFIDNFL